MKHIKKKYLRQPKLTEQASRYIEENFKPLKEIDNSLYKKYSKTHNVLLKTEDELILGFIYNNNGKHIHIPLPDFTLVYYDFAYKMNKQRIKLEKELLNKLTDSETFTEDSSNELYHFYGTATSVIISLFTAIESFMNQILPEDKEYIDVRNNRKEVYNYNQIQEYISFNDKIKKVLPQFFGKNFYQNQNLTNQHITNLKELRDNIVHTKSDNKNEKQIDLFKKLLKFKYEETFESVRKLMNFYDNDYITDCDCGNDF